MSYFGRLFNLRTGEEAKPKVLSNVRSNIYFRGATVWILACAILVASVGLNVNSTAVIIGAMLISPLMGPIIGAGFGLGIYDFVLLKRSLKNLLIATVVSLIVSTVYFYLSPFKEVQTELLSRTSPNIYDVLIAFFGGLAGVIAVTRVEKGLPVAGVAIATALMPPLCTAGFGLASGNMMYFLGALYLYTINCTFICIATYLVVKFLKYPTVNYLDKKERRNVRFIISAITLSMMIPAVFFAVQMFNKQNFIRNAEKFIASEFIKNGNTLIYKNLDYGSTPKTITVAFLTKKYSLDQIDSLQRKLDSFGLTNTSLLIRQDTTGLRNLTKHTGVTNPEETNTESAALIALQNKLAGSTYNNEQLLSEAKAIFPDIVSFSIADHDVKISDTVSKQIPVLIYSSSAQLSAVNQSRLKQWLKSRLNKDSVVTFGDVVEN